MNLFCLYHIEQFFSQYDHQRFRLDLSLKKYFRSHRALGSKDRKIISETLFKFIRHRVLLKKVLGIEAINKETYPLISSFDPEKFQSDPGIDPHIYYGLDETFFELLRTSLGALEFEKFLSCLNDEAPIYGRVNTLKCTREELIEKLKHLTSAVPTSRSPLGVRFKKRENFSSFTAFKEGLFEIQDEASQLVGLKLKAKPKERVLDYCAGSGGKGLLIGSEMKNQGQLYLHDIRKEPLEEAKKRFKRASCQNFQIFHPQINGAKYQGYFDRILLDVPCSGSGTLRRNPDMKSKLTRLHIDELCVLQRSIFEEALSYLKPEGFLLWATCSVLPIENEEQIQYFCEKFSMKKVDEPLKIIPLKDGPDGFYAQMLQRA